MNTIIKPQISILMAVYNTDKFLQEAIESVIYQSYTDWELICINNGSTDSCQSILNSFKETDSRIVIINKPHGSASSARNTGLGISRGLFIVMLDSDDKIEANYLNKLIKRYEETKADIILSSMEYWDSDKDLVTRTLRGLKGDITPIITGKEAFLLSLDWQIGGIGLHTASALRNIGYDETGINGEEYTTRLLFLNSKCVAFCDAEYFYRNNPNSTTRKFSADHFTLLINYFRLFQLVKTNDFSESIIRLNKEKLFKLLMAFNVSYFVTRKQFSSNEKENIINILKDCTNLMSQEISLKPVLGSKPKNIFFIFFLSNWHITLFLSVLWAAKEKLSRIVLKKIVKLKNKNEL